MKTGYARDCVSKSIEMQIEALKNEGIETIYQEKKSAFPKQPELDNSIEKLRVGDTLFVWSFEIFGCNLSEVMNNLKTIFDKGANVYSIANQIDTDKSEGEKMLFYFSVFADMEAALRKERQRASVARAREHGRPLGRRKGLTEKTKKIAAEVTKMYLSEHPAYSVRQITREFKISAKTMYKCLEYSGCLKLRGGDVYTGESGGEILGCAVG